MDTLLNCIPDMLRAAPWLVWVVGIPVVVMIRNRGLALVDAKHRSSVMHRSMWLTIGTLIACTSVLASVAVAYQILSA